MEVGRSLGVEYFVLVLLILLSTLFIVNVLVSGASTSTSAVSGVNELNGLMKNIPKRFT